MAHGERLKAFFEKLKLIFHKVDEYLQSHIDLSISIVTKLRAALESPIADIIVHLIPTSIDDVIREKAIKALDYAVQALSIVKECEAAPTLEEKVICYMEHLKTLPPLVQHAMLHKLASTITAFQDDNKLPENRYDLYVQQNYSVEK